MKTKIEIPQLIPTARITKWWSPSLSEISGCTSRKYKINKKKNSSCHAWDRRKQIKNTREIKERNLVSKDSHARATNTFSRLPFYNISTACSAAIRSFTVCLVSQLPSLSRACVLLGCVPDGLTKQTKCPLVQGAKSDVCQSHSQDHRLKPTWILYTAKCFIHRAEKLVL